MMSGKSRNTDTHSPSGKPVLFLCRTSSQDGVRKCVIDIFNHEEYVLPLPQRIERGLSNTTMAAKRSVGSRLRLTTLFLTLSTASAKHIFQHLQHGAANSPLTLQARTCARLRAHATSASCHYNNRGMVAFANPASIVTTLGEVARRSPFATAFFVGGFKGAASDLVAQSSEGFTGGVTTPETGGGEDVSIPPPQPKVDYRRMLAFLLYGSLYQVCPTDSLSLHLVALFSHHIVLLYIRE